MQNLMEKDNIQKELFEFEAPAQRSRRFSQLFRKADFGINLSAERLVFASIGIVMLLVVSFALGVERGKAVSADRARPKVVTTGLPALQPQVIASVPVKQAVQVKAVNTATDTAPKDKAQPSVLKKAQVLTQSKAADDKGKPYMIIAVAFSRESFAASEVSRMKANGIEAFVYHSEPYYLVCVGAFANKDAAQKTLSRVRQLHRDAYVRLK